jgi:hypothetical protein
MLTSQTISFRAAISEKSWREFGPDSKLFSPIKTLPKRRRKVCGFCRYLFLEGKSKHDMSITFIIRIGLASVLLGAMGCTPAVVTPFPSAVRRIAVLPPYYPGAADTPTAGTDSDLLRPLQMTVGDVLAQQARMRLAEKGLDVVAPNVVQLATGRRVPTSPQVAGQIMEKANLDAAALYIEVRRWEPMPDARALKADGIIVALDVAIVDPKTGTILWQVHRPSRPVPIYGIVLTGQANVFVAETVMQEVFAQSHD